MTKFLGLHTMIGAAVGCIAGMLIIHYYIHIPTLDNSQLDSLEKRLTSLENAPFEIAISNTLPIGTHVKNKYGFGVIKSKNIQTGQVWVEGFFITPEQYEEKIQSEINYRKTGILHLVGYSNPSNYWINPSDLDMFSVNNVTWKYIQNNYSTIVYK